MLRPANRATQRRFCAAVNAVVPGPAWVHFVAGLGDQRVTRAKHVYENDESMET